MCFSFRCCKVIAGNLLTSQIDSTHERAWLIRLSEQSKRAIVIHYMKPAKPKGKIEKKRYKFEHNGAGWIGLHHNYENVKKLIEAKILPKHQDEKKGFAVSYCPYD